MSVYFVMGTNQVNVSSSAASFASQNNGRAGPVETQTHVRADNLDNNGSVANGGPGPVYLCRVDY